jgi:hypothetical protein
MAVLEEAIQAPSLDEFYDWVDKLQFTTGTTLYTPTERG